jgi:hypothetical protein
MNFFLFQVKKYFLLLNSYEAEVAHENAHRLT